MINEIIIKEIGSFLTGISKTLIWFPLIIWGIKILAKEISRGFNKMIKEVPNWLISYEKIQKETDARRGAMKI
jgi:hypothetical protein